MPGGRPTDYREEYCDAVVELGREGKARIEWAAHFDVTKETLANWEEKFPQFLSATTRARQLSEAWWTAQGQRGIWAGPQFNANAYRLQVLNRFRDSWSDRTEQAITGRDGGPLQVEDVSDRDRAKAMALLARKAKAE